MGQPQIVKRAFRGAPTTVSAIVEAVVRSADHYEVRELAEEICQGLRSKDYVSEFLAIFHFVCHRTRYMRDPATVELVRAPWIVADQLRSGARPNLDCDDMTALVAALCLSVGARVRVVTVAFRNYHYNGERQYSHVFAQAQDPRTKVWVTLDPVAGRRTANMLRRVVAAKVWPIN